jgi:hypothetical protein
VYTLLLAAALAAAPQVEVQTLDGRTLVGSLAELDSQRLTLEAAEGRVTLATGELLLLAFKNPPASLDQAPGAWVELVDGSSLIGVEFAVEGETARVTLRDLPSSGHGNVPVEIPRASLATVRLQEQSEQVATEWSRILDMRHATDLLMIRTGEAIDYHKGVLRDVSPSTVQFELDGEVLPVKRSKVHGLVYYHPPTRPAAEPICQITDVGGSRWSVQTLQLADELTWTTPAGLKRTQPVSTVRQIDFSRGKVVFLSDLKPESVTFTPYFGTSKDLPLLETFFGLREDKNLQSGPLQLGSKQYRKGLALHSRTKVVYRLPGRFSRFLATVGIDDAVRPRGNVRLVIYGDDRVLLETTLSGADPAKPVELDLAGVRRITVLADFGAEMDVSDHLDLCEARILK